MMTNDAEKSNANTLEAPISENEKSDNADMMNLLHQIHDNLNHVTNKIDAMETRMSGMETRMSGMENVQEETLKSIDTMGTRITGIETVQEETLKSINNLEEGQEKIQNTIEGMEEIDKEIKLFVLNLYENQKTIGANIRDIKNHRVVLRQNLEKQLSNMGVIITQRLQDIIEKELSAIM